MKNLQENILEIQANIEESLDKVGRTKDEVTLIAVTKTVDVDLIQKSLDLGLNNIGENRVQELQRKYEEIGDKATWHMIGHLQTNKVKYILDKVSLIHSLNRISLAKELNKRAKDTNKIIETLIQVNVAEEESKFGFKTGEVIPFIESILSMENIKIKGLMTIAPYAEDPEEVRYVFRELRNLKETIESRNYKEVDMKYLSMGMTNDYKVAIEEGSNMVRIGTALFGKREYK
ncbi:MAG TPA: YggS family pyridoxal phosphate-dependent enzyme [Tissierellales bacterium]|nr:YggS family pyridoxal phosphate-dependent enzyme [Tissierellales bacterium]